jgi:hypothetical protein
MIWGYHFRKYPYIYIERVHVLLSGSPHTRKLTLHRKFRRRANLAEEHFNDVCLFAITSDMCSTQFGI